MAPANKCRVPPMRSSTGRQNTHYYVSPTGSNRALDGSHFLPKDMAGNGRDRPVTYYGIVNEFTGMEKRRNSYRYLAGHSKTNHNRVGSGNGWVVGIRMALTARSILEFMAASKIKQTLGHRTD